MPDLTTALLQHHPYHTFLLLTTSWPHLPVCYANILNPLLPSVTFIPHLEIPFIHFLIATLFSSFRSWFKSYLLLGLSWLSPSMGPPPLPPYSLINLPSSSLLMLIISCEYLIYFCWLGYFFPPSSPTGLQGLWGGKKLICSIHQHNAYHRAGAL